jgi:hypothetical protein
MVHVWLDITVQTVQKLPTLLVSHMAMNVLLVTTVQRKAINQQLAWQELINQTHK